MKNQSLALLWVSVSQLYRVTEFPPQRRTGTLRRDIWAASPKFIPKICGLTVCRSALGSILTAMVAAPDGLAVRSVTRATRRARACILVVSEPLAGQGVLAGRRKKTRRLGKRSRSGPTCTHRDGKRQRISGPCAPAPQFPLHPLWIAKIAAGASDGT